MGGHYSDYRTVCPTCFHIYQRFSDTNTFCSTQCRSVYAKEHCYKILNDGIHIYCVNCSKELTGLKFDSRFFMKYCSPLCREKFIYRMLAESELRLYNEIRYVKYKKRFKGLNHLEENR
jgi:endogenous inhibitor of DNA gyrase (YacG/DUF329 family)